MKVIKNFKEVGEFILTTTEGDICILTTLDFAMKLQVGDMISFVGFDFYDETDTLILSKWVNDIVNFDEVSIMGDELIHVLSEETFKIVERNLSNEGFALYVEVDQYVEKKLASYLQKFYAEKRCDNNSDNNNTDKI